MKGLRMESRFLTFHTSESRELAGALGAIVAGLIIQAGLWDYISLSDAQIKLQELVSHITMLRLPPVLEIHQVSNTMMECRS